jgi:hypothetical protein
MVDRSFRTLRVLVLSMITALGFISLLYSFVAVNCQHHDGTPWCNKDGSRVQIFRLADQKNLKKPSEDVSRVLDGEGEVKGMVDVSLVPDGEGRPCVAINITTPDGVLRRLPIERLYPNLRSWEFETKFRDNPHNFDNAGNARTPEYLRTLPTVLDIEKHYNRKIMVDLGAGGWGSTSLGGLRGFGWLQNYPAKGQSWSEAGKWDEYHEFDYLSKFQEGQVERPVWLHPQKGLYTYHNKFVVARSDAEGKEEDIISFLKSFSKDDFVVVKMDIENSEWCVIPEMIRTGVIGLIDELALEVHFWTDDPAWLSFEKSADLENVFLGAACPGKHNLTEAFELLEGLRKRGVYTHTWP